MGVMGQIRKRGGIWWIRYYRAGRRYEESSGSDKKGTAIDLLKIREGDGAHGLPVTPKMGRFRFEEATADVVADYKVNGKRSLEDVERRIDKHLVPYFGGRRMMALTTADFRTFAAARQEAKASNAEINRELAIVKRAFRLAVQAGKLYHVPHVPMLRENNVRTGFLEREQFDAAREALPEELRGIVTFAYFCGWRIQSEILPLQWLQVDRDAKTVRLEPGQTKNAEGRTLPYSQLGELSDVIEDQWLAHERLIAKDELCPYVFHREGKRIKNFRKAWQAACEVAECPGKLLHDFRRTAVRNLVRAGVPEKTAMQITGHKTRSVFDRYDIVNEADLRVAIGKLAGTEKGQSAKSGKVAKFRRQKKTA
jgi:integrase